MIKMFKDYVSLDKAIMGKPGDLLVATVSGKEFFFPKDLSRPNVPPKRGQIVGVDLKNMITNDLDEGYYEVIHECFDIEKLDLSIGEKRLLELTARMTNEKIDTFTLHDMYYNPTWPDYSKYTWFINRLGDWYYTADKLSEEEDYGYKTIYHDVFLDRIVPDINHRGGFFKFVINYDMNKLKSLTQRLHEDMCRIVGSVKSIGNAASIDVHASVMLMEYAPNLEQKLLGAIHKHYKGEYDFYPEFMVDVGNIASKQLQITGHDWDAISMYLRCHQEWILDLEMSRD
ncbi:hypothetical protein EZV73_22070 [Acidaminobacter sp. JC074]|uniref:hypothetical protein n=1 Tax=Acidaminobacter sp. JC074 TaxID=2530199 RepID=UPI001F0FFCF7|nr:hypothetical protein [Acidaminobacter sp. JC074]MCH4890285.1 hypothetical protein [Acidaminobacter sp. JC074]